MSRLSVNLIIKGRLIKGFDYNNQAWVDNGEYIACGHPKEMDCSCFGRLHEGMPTIAENRHGLASSQLG